MIDVAVIGGGIAGCATAAFLAEGGATVTLYEREAIGAGASGRNSGIVQHPMDPALVELYEASLALYATLGHGFELPAEPSGVLLVSEDGDALARDFDAAVARFPDLAPEWLEGQALRAEEPALGAGVYAYRLNTGRPIGPTAATNAWAERARAAGARIEVGVDARAGEMSGRAVVVAAGPWTPEALGARPVWRPVF
jgi:sarcosine oxidase subunit beta